MEYLDRNDLSGQAGSTVHRLNVASRLTDLPMNSDSNISPHALGMSVKMELEKRRSTQTLNESQTMYAGAFSRAKVAGMADEISDAADIMKKLESGAGSLVFREALATRMRLRTMALKNFSKHNYSDALMEAHYSLLLAKKFHLQVRKTPLCGEMAMELLILSKCYSHIGHFNKGREHLAEFRFLVENTLLHYSGGAEALSDDAKYAVINCDKKLFLSVVYLLAEILTGYGMWEDAELFFSKYLALYSQTHGEWDLGLSSALNSVCIYMLKSKQYLKALPLSIKSLEILKKQFGDYDSEEPNLRVADAYNNLGIVYRLLNNPVDALQQFFKAIDMKMRIYNDRNHPSIQDVFLSIGCCLHVLGSLSSAASIYKEVYTTRSDYLGRSHSSTLAVAQLLRELQEDISLKLDSSLSDKKEEKVEGKLDEMVKKTFTSPFVDVARIRALYSTKLENKNTALSNIDLGDEVIFPSERLLDLSKKINSKTLNLPVINVPKLSRGTLYVKDGAPAMTLNPEAEDLLRQWGVEPPEVGVLGDLTQSETSSDGIALYIPIVKPNNDLLLGYHDKPLYVPNPALYHTEAHQNRLKFDMTSNFKYLSKASGNRQNAARFVSRVGTTSYEKGLSATADSPLQRGSTGRMGAEMDNLDCERVADATTEPESPLTHGDGLKTVDIQRLDSLKPAGVSDSDTLADQPSLTVKDKVQEMERMKTVKVVEKPVVVERPVEQVPMEAVIKQRLKNPSSAKYLAKIGKLKDIKVKQVAPKFDDQLLKKSAHATRLSRKIGAKPPPKRLKAVPKHRREYVGSPLSSIQSFPLDPFHAGGLDLGSDSDTIVDNDYSSWSETPTNSDFEAFSEYSVANSVFTAPTVNAMLDTAPLPIERLGTRLIPKKNDPVLPLVLTKHNDVLPLEIARRVRFVKTYVDVVLNNFTQEPEGVKTQPSKNMEGKPEVKADPELGKEKKESQVKGDKSPVPDAGVTTPNLEVKASLGNPLNEIKGADLKSVDEVKGNEKAPKVDKNVCVLLDIEGNELAYVPWRIDLVSLSLAQSCLQEDFLKRYSVLYKVNKAYLTKKAEAFAIETDEQKKKEQLLLCRMLLAGQGLEELGFAKIATSMQAINDDLTGGLSFKVPNSILDNIKEQQLLLEKQQRDLEEAKKMKEKLKEAEKAKDVVPKKEAQSKKAPPPPGAGKKAPPPPGSGKKAPPLLKGKGPPMAPGKGGVPKVGKKAPVKAVESNVRRFFWDPIFGDDAKDTIFTSQGMAPRVETTRVEESFAKAAPKAKEKVQETKPKFIQLLPDSKRSYNMNIGLSKFSKYSFSELREAIVHLDPNILSVEATEALLLLLPNNEETSIVSEFVKSGGDLSLVDRPEQFVASLIGIPILRQRLECHQTALAFKDSYNEIYDPLESIMDSCEAVMGSMKLSILSNFILTVGNTLNQGDPKKGNAEGFKPTTYPKLNDFRTTTKPSKTLLQYICDIVGEEDESVLDVLDDLRSLDSASKVDVIALDDKMNRFKNDLTRIKNAINLAQNTKSEYTDHFPSIMNEFLRDAEPKVSSLLAHYQEVMNAFKETVRFTGYTEKEVEKVKPNELFKYIWTFAQSVETCRKQRQEARNKQEKLALAQSNAAAKKAVKQQPKTTKLTAVPKMQNNDLVNIVKSI